MRGLLVASYAAALFALVSLVEGAVSEELGVRDAGALAGVWGAAWLLGAAGAARLAGRAWGRRRLFASTAIAGVAGFLAATRLGPGLPALAGYALASSAAAAGMVAAVASIYREEYSEAWRGLVAQVKAAIGAVQAALLLALEWVGPGVLPPAALALAAAAAVGARDPPVPPGLLKALDDLTYAAAYWRVPRRTPWRVLAGLAGVTGALATAKFLVLPEALESGFYPTLALYAATTTGGAALAALAPSPVAAGALGVLAALSLVALDSPLAELSAVTAAFGYADAALLLLALNASPSRAGRVALASAAWLFLAALAASLSVALGFKPHEAIAAIALAAALSSLAWARGPRWE